MQTTLEETDKHTVKLTIEVPADEYGKDLEKTYRKIAQQVKIPGFRKGKVPRQIIDQQIGRDTVMEEFVHDNVFGYYVDAVREHDLAPIADPDINIDEIEEGRPLTFTATLEVRPRLELKADDYKGTKVERPKVEIGDAEVDEFVDRLRDRFAELEVVSHPAHPGDYVVADIRATHHDEEIPEATLPDFLYEVGSGVLVDKLDDELEDKRSGEILKFNAPLPDGFGDRAGLDVSFQVLVKEVKAKKLPEADDAFAKTASEFDTIDELRADLREKLTEQAGQEADHVVRDRVLDAMIETVDADIPERLIDEETESRVQSATERAERAGTTLDEALDAQGWDELRFRADARDHAIRGIKADLVLEAVARTEDLQVSGEELAEQVATLAQALGRDPKDLAKTLNSSGQMSSLAGDIIRTKALDVLVDNADVVTGDALSADDEGDIEPSPEATGGSEE
jgi:trigger factor